MKHSTSGNIITGMFFTLLILLTMSFAACTEEKNEGDRENNPYIVELGESLNKLQDLRDNSQYGDRKGMYPPESKSILEDVMAEIGQVIMNIYSGEEANPTQDKITQLAAKADQAETNFKATVLTENTLYPAELYVNGNDGGYIDFGTSDDYIKFGEPGKRAFTVELWLKFKTIPGGIGAVISTFVEDSGVRCGWMVNMISGNYLRITYAQKEKDKLWEPGDGFAQTETWVHVAAVYDDNGVDGSIENGKPVVAKYYVNGVLKNKVVNGETYSGNYYGGNDNALPSLPMIAFAQFNKDGSQTRKSQGYIKDFHIWKTAKSENEINKLMDGTTQVTGEETDLACGWEFTMTADDDNNIKDITGKHTAVLKGKFEWERLD
ncbi:MAG: DUF4972 domain-containing protein [Dysgonomonas sp.]